MAGFKARFAKSLDDIVAVLNLNLRDLEKSSLGGTKTILKGSSDSAPESILIPNPVASVVNTEHDLLQGLNKGGYLHLIPALHAYVESLQSREDVADGFAMLNASRVVPVERLPIDDILTPHLSAVNPHVQYILGSQKGLAGGVCDLDSQAMVPIERIPVDLLGGLTPKGVWDPATNTPTLANPAPATTRGWFYIASGSGTALGEAWGSGDWCMSNGAIWQRIPNVDSVASVFGRTGAVTAQAGDYAAHYAPLNTTLAANTGSATPPATASGSLVSKLQALRDNVVYILAHLLTLGETSATAYRGDRGKTAYDHSQAAHAPANADNTQSALNAGDSKTTPVDADTLAMLDSAASNSIKKLTWANVKATLKAYLDGVYEPKLTAGDTAKYYRGDKTWQDLAGAVRSTVLTGLASGTNAAITASDSILGAFSKVQEQITALVTTVTSHLSNRSNPHGVTKAQVGLGSVDDTSDTNKPVSTAQQTALNTKLSRDGSQTMDGNLIFQGVSGTASRYIQFGVGDNDFARVMAGANAENDGWLEIATADDGQEPIYLRQYIGVFSTVKRSATLLDALGNTQFPGTVTATGFNGHATSATHSWAMRQDGIFEARNIDVPLGGHGEFIAYNVRNPKGALPMSSIWCYVTEHHHSEDDNLHYVQTFIDFWADRKFWRTCEGGALSAWAEDATTAWVKDVAAPINATLTNEPSQDVLPTGTYAITAILQWFRNNLSQLFTSVAGKAPTSHASTATTYGCSDATNFGHAMASSAAPAMNGTASAGTDNGKFTREGHVHPSDTSKMTGSARYVGALTTSQMITPSDGSMFFINGSGLTITLSNAATDLTTVYLVFNASCGYSQHAIQFYDFAGVLKVLKTRPYTGTVENGTIMARRVLNGWMVIGY